jgi:hypothetical protein
MRQMRRLLQSSTETLTHICGCEEYEGALLARDLTHQEKIRLSQITIREMNGVQELLFRIMTASYDLDRYKIINGVDWQSAIAEALEIIYKLRPRYSGSYAYLVYEYGITPLHIKIISRKISVNIIHCADKTNGELREFREAQRKYLRNWDVMMTFDLFIRHHFSFEDTIKILHQHTLKQVKEIKNHARELDSCVGWARDTLMQYDNLYEVEAMRIITSMIINDKPLPPHQANIARPFRNQFNRLFSAENNPRHDNDTFHTIINVSSDYRCDFLAEKIPSTNFQPYGDSITSSCENLLWPSGIFLLGAAGAFYLIFGCSSLKKISNHALSLFSNCRRKEKSQQPPHSTEMDVESQAKPSKTA